MKKPFIIAISLLICGILLLSGCATPSSSLPSELTGQKGNYPKSVNIIAPDFFRSTGAANVKEAKQQWLDDMSQRYGVQFNIFLGYNETGKSDPIYASREVSQGITDGEYYTGLTSVETSSYNFKSGILYGAFMPLEDYLADNPVWNALPEEFRSRCETDGHIYAIPASISEGAQKARLFQDKTFQKAGVTVTDLETFRDFASAYRVKTGNTVSSTYLSEVTDILNAFGLYPGIDEYTPFNYDPTADCYVDWLTKPAAVSALEYIRELNSSKTINYMTSQEITELFLYGNLASEYVPYYDYENCTEVLTLNPEYPQLISAEVNGFAMAKDTPQPKETVNLLVDILFGSEQNYLDCWLGSENYALNSDGTLTIKMAEDSEGNAVPPCVPNLTGGLSDIFPYSEANISYSQTGGNSADAKNKERLKLLVDSLANGSLVEIPPEFQTIRSAAFGAMAEKVAGSYHSCIFYAICYPSMYPDKTVQQLVDEYKAKMLKRGGNQMLDEMNAAIGKKTAYYYG